MKNKVWLLITFLLMGCSNGNSVSTNNISSSSSTNDQISSSIADSREVNLVRCGGPNFIGDRVYKIDSKEELDEYSSNMYEQFNEYVNKYNETYFSDKLLMIAHIEKGTGSAKITYKSVSFEDENMIIKFSTYYPYYMSDDMAYWHLIIECDKSELENITSVRVIESIVNEPNDKFYHLED